MSNNEAEELIKKYVAHTATEEEIALLNSWYNHRSNAIEEKDLIAPDYEQLAKIIGDKLPINSQQKTNFAWIKYGIAASILICAGLLYSTYSNFKENSPIVQQTHQPKAIIPGKNAATLILSNGKKITLTDGVNGNLADEAGINISKTKDGQLIYEIVKSVRESNQLNTLVTARGETYQVRLPDGSLVWLNAASSLSYSLPLNTDGKRIVTLKGEAYFEVAKDAKHPFIVRTLEQDVEVLGTHFNISSYPEDKSTMTTLLEGSVKVVAKRNKKVLVPNQQLLVSDNDFSVKNVNTDQVVAWKNGLFLFDDEPLESIMKKIARWYDVDVIYKNVDKGKLFWGGVSRYTNVNKVLKKLELTSGVKFKVEERRIIIGE